MAPFLQPGERLALRRAVRLLDLDPRQVVWAVLAGSAALGSAVALSAVSAWLIARAAEMPPVLHLTVATVAVRLFGISRPVMRYVERLASHRLALRGMATLRERVYDLLAAAPNDAVARLRRGDLLTRTGQDVDAIGDVVVRALLPAAVAAVVGVGSVALVGWLHPGVGAVLALCLLLAGVVGPWLAGRAARAAEAAHVQARADISSTAMTLVDGAAELTVDGRVPQVLGALRRQERMLAHARDAAARPAALAAGTDTFALGVAVLAALALGVPATVAGTLTGVELAVVVLTPLAAFEGTAALPAAASQLARSASSAVRIMDLLDGARPPAPAAVRPTTPPDVRSAAPTGGPGQLRARDLTIGWPGGPVAAEGIDLDVAPGRSIAVVGASGSGKTTLLLTLAGMLPARAGTVRLDGVSPRPEPGGGVVLTAEDAHVFATTVLENLRVARGDVTEAEARDLLAQAGLSTWLSGLPEGVHTVLGADAATLSGGERRRILLARALASRARILLLDEPGEHLDPDTADRLVTDLLRAGRDGGQDPRGVVLVTHRLAPLRAADEVVLLGVPGQEVEHLRGGPRTRDTQGASGGTATVLARGTHAELLATVPAYRWAAEQEAARGRVPVPL